VAAHPRRADRVGLTVRRAQRRWQTRTPSGRKWRRAIGPRGPTHQPPRCATRPCSAARSSTRWSTHWSTRPELLHSATVSATVLEAPLPPPSVRPVAL